MLFPIIGRVRHGPWRYLPQALCAVLDLGYLFRITTKDYITCQEKNECLIRQSFRLDRIYRIIRIEFFSLAFGKGENPNINLVNPVDPD